jgi:ferredoxin-NADP reductase
MLKLRLIDFKQRDVQDLCLSPSYAGQAGWLIGNNVNCDLVLPNSEIDCVYGRIFYHKGTYHFVDLGSKAESSINGEPVPVGSPRQLCEGDLLQVGRTSLYFKAFSPPSTVSEQLNSNAHLQNHSQVHSQVHPQNRSPRKQAAAEILCRCSEVIHETPDVKTFYFVPESSVPFDYQPGQFVNLQVEIDGKSVIRPYTLSSSPSRPGLAITVKRCPAPQDVPNAPRGLVSNWLHDRLQKGDRVKLVGQAMGHFTCAAEVPPKLLFISAGSGITPMMSMSRWLQDTGANCNILFLHSARTPEDIIFHRELEEMAASMPNFRLAITVTQTAPKSTWTGLTGRISASLLRLVVPDLRERSVYVCGTNGFMQHIKAMLEAMNFPMQHYQAESFGGTTLSLPVSSQNVSA